MKNKLIITGIGSAVVLGAAVFAFGGPTQPARVVAFDGPEAVGIVVKTGTKMDTLLANNFTLVSEPCDTEATSTEPVMCDSILYQERPVNVFYAVRRNTNNQLFREAIGAFPFSGSIDYINRTDEVAEARLIQFMLESGSGSYTILYES